MKINTYTYHLKGLAILAVCLMAFVPATVAQWASPQTLFPGTAVPEPGPFWVSPVIVAQKDPSGVLHLVWTNKVNDERNALAHASFANGIWSEMEILPSALNSSAMMPSMAITPDGRLHVAYTSFLPDGTWGILYTSKPAGGQWSQPAMVSNTEYMFNAYAQLFFDAQQTPHVIYIAYPENAQETLLKHVKFNVENPGQAVQLPVPANSQHAFNPRVVKTQDGLIHVFWYDSANEDRTIAYAFYDGSTWSATTTLVTSQNSLVMDESAIVPVATPANDVYALWYSMEPVAGMYKHYTPAQGWGSLQQVEDAAFVMASGISDSQSHLHVAGNSNDEINEVYDMKYHMFNGTHWTHELIEQATTAVLPSFPAMVVSGDTLYCFYARIFESGGSELAVSWKILDYLTPVKDLPVNKEIALKVSPNPMTSSSVLSFNAQKRGEVRFILTDALGRAEFAKLQVSETGVNAINFTTLFPKWHRKGVYILKILTSTGTDSVTLIK